ARFQAVRAAARASARRCLGWRLFPTWPVAPADHHRPADPRRVNPGERSMPTREQDPCHLRDAAHPAGKTMFTDSDDLTNSRGRPVAQKKMDLARQICHELTVHAQIEEEIFYPALRAVMKDTDLLAEAEVEHQSAKDLIAQIEAMGEADEMFDAKVTVLGEYIDHHVKEERNEIFPKARSARKLDLVAMRDQRMERKQE